MNDEGEEKGWWGGKKMNDEEGRKWMMRREENEWWGEKKMNDEEEEN